MPNHPRLAQGFYPHSIVERSIPIVPNTKTEHWSSIGRPNARLVVAFTGSFGSVHPPPTHTHSKHKQASYDTARVVG